jgi:KilA-N domain
MGTQRQAYSALKEVTMKNKILVVQGIEVAVTSHNKQDYICLTDMLRAKDGDFFIANWLRNRNTIEFLGIWEGIYNPGFNYGEFATIKSQAGLKEALI